MSGFLRLKPSPGGAWPPLPAPAVAPVWAAYLSLDRSQWLPREEVAAGQLAQVRELLAHCAAHVPYYRELLRGVGPVETWADFRRLPVLARADYQRRFPDLLAESLPPGHEEVGKLTTSGTRGVPVEVRQTARAQLFWQACYLRDLQWSGIDPRGRLAAVRVLPSVGPAGVELPCWHPPLDALIETGPAFGLDLHRPLGEQLDWLRRVRPDYLLGHATSLDVLAVVLLERGETLPGLRALQAFGETLTPEAEARMRAAFGVPVHNLYSCSEAGYVASPCPEGHGLHVHAENCVVEVLDDAGEPCGPGERGRILLTPLHSFRTPMVRYEIADEATVGAACLCGRGLPLLTRVWGKSRPLLALPGGGAKGCQELLLSLRVTPGVRQHQIVQRAPDEFLFRLATAGGAWSPERESHVRKLAERFAGAPVRVAVEVFAERLPLPPGGKLLDVVRECPVDPAGGPHTPARRRPVALLGWELGAGLGHVRPLCELAAALERAGLTPVLALRSTSGLPAGLPFAARTVSVPDPPAGAPAGTATGYADLLAAVGFGDAAHVLERLRAWDAVLADVRPDVVVCDHAPSLRLACLGTVPVVTVGGGFLVPPAEGTGFAPLVTDRAPLADPARLLEAVSAAQRRRGRPMPDTLPAAVLGEERLVTCFPELDPYPVRPEPRVGPLVETFAPSPEPPASFFVYAQAEHPDLWDALGRLAGAGLPGAAFPRGAAPAQVARLRALGLDAFDAPLPPEQIAARYRVLVHSGTNGLAHLALAAGRPQLVLPVHLEQALTARSLHALGVAHYLIPPYDPAHLAEGLRQLAHEPRFARAAAERAADLARRGPWDAAGRVVGACARLAGLGRPTD